MLDKCSTMELNIPPPQSLLFGRQAHLSPLSGDSNSY